MPLVLSWALGDPLVFVDEAAKDGPASDPLLGQVDHRVIGPGWTKLTAAMRASSVVVGLVPGQDRPQMSFAGDQHPVDDLGPGGEHEPLRKSIGPHRQQHLISMIGTDVCG